MPAKLLRRCLSKIVLREGEERARLEWNNKFPKNFLCIAGFFRFRNFCSFSVSHLLWVDSLDSLTTLQALQINLCSLFPPFFLSQTGNLGQGTSGTSRAKVEQFHKKGEIVWEENCNVFIPSSCVRLYGRKIEKDQMEKKRLGSFSTVPFSFSRIFRP